MSLFLQVMSSLDIAYMATAILVFISLVELPYLLKVDLSL